jgi:proline iminopeptidase
LLGTFNTLEKLPGITTPSLVIAGRHDGITPPEPGAERIASALPNAEIAIFEGSGHYPFIEEREAFFAQLTQWLSR